MNTLFQELLHYMILDYDISNLSLLLHDILPTYNIINKMRVKDNINCNFCLIETYSYGNVQYQNYQSFNDWLS